MRTYQSNPVLAPRRVWGIAPATEKGNERRWQDVEVDYERIGLGLYSIYDYPINKGYRTPSIWQRYMTSLFDHFESIFRV